GGEGGGGGGGRGEKERAPGRRGGGEARGHHFASRTDIEVIVHAYEEHGTACLERLDGMFAIALWDARRRLLLLARDRFGEKPLYIARRPNATLFASELKALLVHPDVSRTIDWNAFVDYLVWEYVPAPRAIFQDIRKIPPAHWLTIDAEGRETLQRYWTPPAAGTAVADSEDVAGQVV